jgi:hypothetical protein
MVRDDKHIQIKSVDNDESATYFIYSKGQVLQEPIYNYVDLIVDM